MLSRSGIMFAPGSIEFRLIHLRQTAEEIYRLRSGKVNNLLRSMTARLLVAQLGESIDTQAANSNIDTLVSEYEESIDQLLGKTKSKGNEPETSERQAQAEKTKQFLKDTAGTGKGFGSLDDIMKNFVNS